jgi:Ribbon-helix-helix protein, copG family
MVKTTLYLPDELKHDLEETARRRGISEAELYRQALQAVVDSDQPRPQGGIFQSKGGPGTSDLSLRVDEVLAETGFGE